MDVDVASKRTAGSGALVSKVGGKNDLKRGSASEAYGRRDPEVESRMWGTLLRLLRFQL